MVGKWRQLYLNNNKKGEKNFVILQIFIFPPVLLKYQLHVKVFMTDDGLEEINIIKSKQIPSIQNLHKMILYT